jgi:XTP/dITP diphosphohydrolase
MDGIALAQPALSLAAKVLQRGGHAAPAPSTVDDEDGLGRALFALVAAAHAAGLDPEQALRKAALAAIEETRRAEEA